MGNRATPTIEFTPADMAMRMDYAGNHPGKLATIVALSTFDGDGYATRAELMHRLNQIQGAWPRWDFTETPRTGDGYCKKALEPAGLVETGKKIGASGKPVAAFRLTPAGRTDGLALAGALLPLELTAQEGTSLQGAMGLSGEQRAKGGGEPARLAMYRYLVDSPRGAAASVELQRATGRSQGTTDAIIRDLVTAGIFSSIERSLPDSRTFRLSEPPGEIIASKKMYAGTLAVIKAARWLQQQGKVEVTGAELLDAARLADAFERAEAWKNFRRWVLAGSNVFLTDQRVHDNLNIRTKIAITQKWRPFLRELLRVRDLLSGEDERAAAFRASALKYGQQLPQRPRTLATVLGRTREYIQQKEGEWLDRIPDLVPEDGITATELHRIAVTALGIRISYIKFRDRVEGDPAFTVSRQPGMGASGGRVSYVSLAPPPEFAADWNRRAACRGHDPELFYPDIEQHEKAAAQAAAAQKICKGCPVRLACLKTTLETKGKKFGVSGGIWWEEPHNESPLTAKEQARAMAVQIGPRPTN